MNDVVYDNTTCRCCWEFYCEVIDVVQCPSRQLVSNAPSDSQSVAASRRPELVPCWPQQCSGVVARPHQHDPDSTANEDSQARSYTSTRPWLNSQRGLSGTILHIHTTLTQQPPRTLRHHPTHSHDPDSTATETLRHHPTQPKLCDHSLIGRLTDWLCELINEYDTKSTVQIYHQLHFNIISR